MKAVKALQRAVEPLKVKAKRLCSRSQNEKSPLARCVYFTLFMFNFRSRTIHVSVKCLLAHFVGKVNLTAVAEEKKG
jgi:hypothetical protein